MAATATAQREQAQPIVTVQEIDEALAHTIARAGDWTHTPAMSKWIDALLDQRNRIARSGPARECRVIYPTEYRDGQ